MFGSIITKIIGSKNEREIKKLWPIVAKINAMESSIASLGDDQLRGKTAEFKERHAKGESLDALLPEAFAVCREAGKRVLNMRHFDVQLIGGMVLHSGKIAEMKTGEGKTLVATLPAYLNAISGKGVHVVTVNDYLAKRDSEWMGRLYGFLGLTVGVIVHGVEDDQRRINYAADITYGTNNEFGFDYLRDNMKFDLQDMVQLPVITPMVKKALVCQKADRIQDFVDIALAELDLGQAGEVGEFLGQVLDRIEFLGNDMQTVLDNGTEFFRRLVQAAQDPLG